MCAAPTGVTLRSVLITGGVGFIGSHLADRLLGEGWRVFVVDNFDPFYSRAAKEQNVLRALGNARFSLIDADICDKEAMTRELSGDFDVIVHLAAKAGVRPSIEDPIGYQDVNVRGTQTLLELARTWGVKQFVFGSSSSVYGVNPRVPWSEDDHVLRPISPYASSKVSGELLGHVYNHLYGIRFLALRFFTVYGPRQRPDLAIHKFANLMREGKPIPLFGDGGTMRDYTFVGDIVSGIGAAIDYDASGYEIVNLGNSRTVSLLELIRELEGVTGIRAKIDWQPEQPGDVPQTFANISKAKALLGYRPATDLRAGLAEFWSWMTDAQVAPK
jgi:UDP-glucuronate 4-epimerase